MAPLNRSHPSSSNPNTTLQHFIHPQHPLHLLHSPSEFFCNGCSAPGSGPRYRCERCDVDLHEICATCPVTLTSPLHPQHPLILVNQPVHDRSCDVCGDVVHGLFYTCCGACGFELHPLCTRVPLHVRLPTLHPQHLLRLQPAGPAACALCCGACTAWSWRYRCEACWLDMHLECVGEAMAAPQPVGVGGVLAVGVPAGGGYYHGGGFVQSPASNFGGGGTSDGSGRRRRMKIYAIVGRLVASAVVTSIIGIPFGS